MTFQPTEILSEATNFVRQWYQKKMPATLAFHSFLHVQEVLKVVDKLIQKEGIEPEEAVQLQLAGQFQYTGLANDTKHYQEESVKVFTQFLAKQGHTAEAFQLGIDLILSTKQNKTTSHLEQILYDANHYYLGKKNFFTHAKLIRLEWEHINGKNYTEKAWSKELMNLIINTNYYTKWARKKYSKQKLKNLAKQKELAVKAGERTLKSKTGKNIGRAVDTLYRTNFRNHINLSQIADGKANMMISINTIVLSIVITVSSAGIGFIEDFLNNHLIYLLPILIILLSSVIALIFAVFSARPTITNSQPEIDLKKKDVNLLYFGSFIHIEKEAFVDYLSELKKDQNRLYDDLASDLYNLGLVLDKKYRLLTYSYNIFVGGVVASVLVLILILLFSY
jgi:predicted MPP superfamily phosphohydrolase